MATLAINITKYCLLVALTIIHARIALAANPKDKFLSCYLNQTHKLTGTYTTQNSDYKSILASSAQNYRFLASSTTKKPSYIIQPSVVTDVQAIVLCGKQHNLSIRVRSGGHDYEGLSYTATGATAKPFILVDLVNFQSTKVNAVKRTATVGAGATIGQLYYAIGAKNDTLAFPGSICTTVGVGGLFGGGGMGTLMRKHGLSADNVVDATIVVANGTVLDRASMGEELFWAIRGGGAASFGVVLSFQVKLVVVPPKVTVFTVTRTLKTTALVQKWQYVAPLLDDKLFLRAIVQAFDDGRSRNVKVKFQGLHLGGINEALMILKFNFPELKLQASDCIEMTWLQSVLYFADYKPYEKRKILLDRTKQSSSSFKAKSDFVKVWVNEQDLQEIWKLLMDGRREYFAMIMDPMGGAMDKIPSNDIAFPYRKGHLYNIQYFMNWTSEAQTTSHLNWMRVFYSNMAPYVSAHPRGAYVNYKDLDLGSNLERSTSYKRAKVWGSSYFGSNFERLARVKTLVDPENYFWNEQSIPIMN